MISAHAPILTNFEGSKDQVHQELDYFLVINSSFFEI